MPAIHKATGPWTVCNRFSKRFFTTDNDAEVTCKVCLAGGMSKFRLNYKTMSAHNHDEETMKRNKPEPGVTEQLQNAFKNNNREKWDSILTDAIELTEGSIQPYDRILKYLSTHYKIEKQP
jgi:hypothetical protein